MRNYLIIGGSSGIGAAIVAELAKKDAMVYASYKSNQQQSRPNIQYFFLDTLQDLSALDALPEQIDGIAYCPGAILLKPFARISTEEFLKDYQLQVMGAVQIIQALLPRLKKSDAASIVLFSTVAVQMGFNFHSLVAASKGAIEGLTRSLAAEFAPKIRVNCIAPSITETGLAGSLLNSPEKIEANAQRHPLKKIGSPKDIAQMACFLLTEASSWMTGQILQVDGGMSAIKL